MSDSTSRRGGKISVPRMPTEEQAAEMVKALSKMRPRGNNLLSLVDLLRDGIKSARANGTGWQDIADYLREQTGAEVSADAVAQSYTASEREAKNRGRKVGEPSYADLAHRYAVALAMLAKASDMTKAQAEESVLAEIERLRERRKAAQDKDKQEG